MGGRAYNAGAGGMAIKTNYPVRVGDELTMELRVPNAPRPVRVAGEVTWRKFHGDSSGHQDALFTAGIKFVDPKEASQTILHKYIQNLPNLTKTGEG
jgi:Tfp pilus assembly protein PilZ